MDRGFPGAQQVLQEANPPCRGSFPSDLQCAAGDTKNMPGCMERLPLREEDQAKMIFLTPWGTYHYRTTPQGFVVAGDAYTARYDDIVADMRKCVDDSILWAEGMEGMFSQTCEYISHCARAGVTFNIDKFVFGAREGEFVGFWLDQTSVRPTKLVSRWKVVKNIENMKEALKIRSLLPKRVK